MCGQPHVLLFRRGKYAGLTWEQRLQENSKRRELIPALGAVGDGIAKCLGARVSAEEQLPARTTASHRWRLQVKKNRVGKVDMKAARAARSMYKISKTCITRSVFMGLLKMAGKGAEGQAQIVNVPESQPFRDGTVFEVCDFRKLCCVLMRAYHLVSEEDVSGTHQRHTNEVLRFVDSGIALAKAGGTTRKAGEPCRSCKPWMCFKKGIKDANVQPLHLVAKNSGLDANMLALYAADETLGKLHEGAKHRVDWFVYRYWFMGHSVTQRESCGDYEYKKSGPSSSWDDDEERDDVSEEMSSISSRSNSVSDFSSAGSSMEEDRASDNGKRRGGVAGGNARGEEGLQFEYRLFSEWGEAKRKRGDGDNNEVRIGSSAGGHGGRAARKGKLLASPFDPEVVRVVERAVADVLGS